MARCLLALGSNLGERRENLDRAAGEVASLAACHVVARSRWHETTPIGGPTGQGEFLNGVLLVETRLAPDELSTALHEIERRLGRERIVRWDARVIDIDVVLYGRERVETDALVVPHPRMSFRRFVLEPACEIAGFMLDPVSGWTLAQLLRHLDTSPRRVAIVASTAESAARLAREISRSLGARGPASLIPTVSSGADLPRPLGVELTVPPALTVVWDDPAGRAGQWSRGPVARIVGDDFAVVLAEAVAAIRAAWPELAAGHT
jgi:2-amino-4-hydroxy-6-hydroxymethyldihydropteridine diphosphokinase